MVKNVNVIDISKLINKRDDDTKVKDIEDKIPIITNWATNAALNAKINEVKNEIPLWYTVLVT